MQLTEVKSSNIKAVGYEDDDLIVEYLGGTKYKYTKVPREVYEKLLEAESKGKYINSEIKGKYLYERLLNDK